MYYFIYFDGQPHGIDNRDLLKSLLKIFKILKDLFFLTTELNSIPKILSKLLENIQNERKCFIQILTEFDLVMVLHSNTNFSENSSGDLSPTKPTLSLYTRKPPNSIGLVAGLVNNIIENKTQAFNSECIKY